MNTKCRTASALFIVAAVSVGIQGCSSDAGTTDDPYGAGSGGTQSNGGTGGGALPSCGQTCQDYLVSLALIDTLVLLYNQNIAGTAVGEKDASGPCPLGGTVQITGMTALADNGVNSADLAYDLVGCENSDVGYQFTWNGVVSQHGTFETGVFHAMTYASPSLGVSGALDFVDDPEIDGTFDLSVTREGTDGSLLNGSVDGRPFNSETALDDLSGGGTGGGGAGTGGTGGGTDCQCFCPDGSNCTDASEPNPCGVDVDGIPEPCGCPADC